MRSALLCCLVVAVLHCVLTASAASVGLYAPDRYDGIPEMCLMPMDFGHCRAKVKRYYFDMRRMKCAMFYFGGCAGNVNNFKSLEECNKVCTDGYEDYDGPNDVAVSKSRDYSRGRSSSGSSGSNSNKNNSYNNDSIGSNSNKSNTTAVNNNNEAANASYKNTYNKYSSFSNYGNKTNNNSNNNNNSSSNAAQNRSDDNVEEYDYEEN